MKFNDAKMPQDTIEATIREETHGDLIEVEIQGDCAECVYLTKKDAKSLGEHLISLSEQI
jgi:hypothetical protein